MKYLSIITSTFNAEKNIEDTIKSVVKQKNDYVEYIIIDGKSSDHTMEIINKYLHVIDYVSSEKDYGVYDAMNKGISIARGKYLYFLQAGDELHNDAVDIAIKYIKKNINNISFIYGNVLWKQKGVIYDGSYNSFKLVRKNICQQSILYHRECFNMLGLFETDYKILADYVFNIKCFGNKNIHKIYLNKTLANYDSGLSNNMKDKKLTRVVRYKLIYENLGWRCFFYAVINSLFNFVKLLFNNSEKLNINLHHFLILFFRILE